MTKEKDGSRFHLSAPKATGVTYGLLTVHSLAIVDLLPLNLDLLNSWKVCQWEVGGRQNKKLSQLLLSEQKEPEG